jgi:hypothetical protein
MRSKIAIRWTALFAFLSFISFIQINSYFSDKHHLWNVWLGAGILFAVIAVVFLIITIKNGGGGSSSGVGAR